MRLIRSRARQFGILPDRVAVLGFSAGGHLAGSLAARHAESVYARVDEADRLSARPDIAGLIYPVVSLDASFTHACSRDALLGPAPTKAARRARSAELRVTEAARKSVASGKRVLVPVELGGHRLTEKYTDLTCDTPVSITTH